MDKRDRDNDSDDGIVAEDVTQLVEHIELTGPQRLPDAPDWEMATPAADLDDAPIMLDEVDATADPGSAGAPEDNEYFTETQFDLGRHLPDGERLPDAASALAAERARWQKRVESLLMSLAERDQLLAERERQIEELSARLATRTLEREGIALELRDARRDAGLPEGDVSMPDIATPAAGLAASAAAQPAATDNTAELPQLELPRVLPAAAPEASPGMRRYLIGIDLVGCVHEVTRHRVNIGRTQDNDLRILDPTVSRLHAMLTVRNGEAMVVDANSTNGVFVNGIQVRYARLEDGDQLTFGTVRFRYRVGTGASDGVYAAA
ncbi:MAG TPA: FHA domain-containing protein [Steroidobacteraceae bacterium]